MRAALLVVALTALGCSPKGLFGVELGAPVDAAKKAFEPLSGEGAWTADGDRHTWTAENGAPHSLFIEAAGGEVAVVRAVFEDAAIAAAGRVASTYRFDLEKAQQPKDAQGPFEHRGRKVWATPAALFLAAGDGSRFEVARWRRTDLGAAATSCDAALEIAKKLDAGIRRDLGEDGVRTGEAREHVVLELVLLAAAAELTCPEASGVLTTVGDLFRATGAHNGALERYKKALSDGKEWGHKSAADANAGLGAVYFRFSKRDLAAERYRAAIEGAGSDERRAAYARLYADDLHQAHDLGEAAKYYKVYLDNLSGADVNEALRAHARLARASLEADEGGCKTAQSTVREGMELSGGNERARAALFAAKAFTTIACDPKRKKAAYRDLEQAVKLDPLMAAEWASLAAYYDREAQDEMVLKIMLDQGWLDPGGVTAAKAFQAEMRQSNR